MRQIIQSVEDLGLILRAVRKTSSVRQDDLAHTVGVSKQFTADVERGKSSVQMGLVLKLLEELGIALSVDIPDSVAPELQRLKAQRSTKSELQPEPSLNKLDKSLLLLKDTQKPEGS